MSSNPNFSQIYGIQAEEFRRLLDDSGKRVTTLAFLKTYPNHVRFSGLRKAKAKAMVNALIQGYAENGNHLVTCFGNQYHFFYRGTLIYKWDAEKDTEAEVHAGKYEDTASTINQRKEIKKAIANFREAVLNV